MAEICLNFSKIAGNGKSGGVSGISVSLKRMDSDSSSTKIPKPKKLPPCPHSICKFNEEQYYIQYCPYSTGAEKKCRDFWEKSCRGSRR